MSLQESDRVRELRSTIPRWPALLAALAIGLIDLLLSERYALGPRWSVLVLVALLLVPAVGARRIGYHRAAHWLRFAIIALVTLALVVSVVVLVIQLLGGKAQATILLSDAALIWLTNILVFALWYWELDGGGPAQRHPGPHCSSDFAFPQMQQGGDVGAEWAPHFLDYFFLAFNTSTAFSPTDTMVLARRAKVLMMLQSLISLIVIAVLAARAINTLGS